MWMTLGILFALICIALLGVMIYDSTRFVTVSYRLTVPHLKKRMRIVLLADLHNKRYGEKNQKLLAAVDTQKPDVVLSAGDLITSKPKASMQNAMDLVRALSEKYPVYCGNGNHEYRIFHDPQTYGRMGERWRAFLKGSHVRMLENAGVFLEEYNVRICGLDLPMEFYKKLDRGRVDKKTLCRLIGKKDENVCSVLLAHNPVFFETYADWGAELTLSGHVHGGIVRLPVIGGVLSTSLTLFPRYDGGLYEKNGKKMIISRGLGSHTIPVRLFNPAELVSIELIPEDENGNGA
ncbi:MAG: metallophosphoesterase [Eisenbergiella sp.]|nr:metallophosphoesterase [Bacillota bacterium]